MINKEDALGRLRLLVPPSGKIYYHVNGESVGPEVALWTFRFFVAKDGEIVIVTPLFSHALGLKTTDIEFFRVRGTQQVDRTLSELQQALSQVFPGVILSDLSTGSPVVEMNLLEPLVPVPAVPELPPFDFLEDGKENV